MKAVYRFTSDRLGFRAWSTDDLNEFAELNADPAVMEHFPKPLSRAETAQFIQRLQAHDEANGYHYFATEILATGELIGFIGLAYQQYEAPFLPATDIGWRLKRSAWGKGYATEGAQRCLDLAFNELGLDHVVSVCILQNTRSEKVMQKIGMQKMGTFQNSRLKDYPEMQNCVWYKLEKSDWEKE